MLKLGLVRARALCDRLRLPPGVLEMVFRVVEHCVCSEVQLLFRRHLDQIILCALYGVCKVSHPTHSPEPTARNLKPQTPNTQHPIPQL